MAASMRAAVLVVFASCLLLPHAIALYEDQIAKFDWRQQYVGKMRHISFDKQPTSRKIIVATEDNVLAAVNPKTGQIVWRQVLEKGADGTIRHMSVDEKIVTVSGVGQYAYVRGWDVSQGFLLYEWVYPIQRQTSEQFWVSLDDTTYHIELLSDSITVSAMLPKTGSVLRRHNFPCPWLKEGGKNQCIPISGRYIACLDQSDVILLDPASAAPNSTATKFFPLPASLKGAGKLDIGRVDGPAALATLIGGGSTHLLHISLDELELSYSRDSRASEVALVSLIDDRSELVVEIEGTNGAYEIRVMDLDTGSSIPELTGKLVLPPSYGRVEGGAALCSLKKERGLGCRLMLHTEDHALLAIQFPGKLLWAREEALASIVSVEMLDLPISEGDVAIEAEFDSKETGFVGMIWKRLYSQGLQLRMAFLATMGLREPPSSQNQRLGLVRDEFGLHKMVVAATSSGKVFGMDTLDGRIVWQHWLGLVETFSGSDDESSPKGRMPLFVQRSSRHYPFPAQCALLARDQASGTGVLFVFNPISGQVTDGDQGLIRLPYKVTQATLMHHTTDDSLKGILLLDDQERVHVYPESTRKVAFRHAVDTYLFAAHPSSGEFVGYSVAGGSTDSELSLTRVWSMSLPTSYQKVTHVVGKNAAEKVHSQGRVLGDRSVLYKYLNPNLVVVVAEGSDPVHKNFLNIYLLDVVSGSLVSSLIHRRCRGPVQVVHSENWVVYSYFNERSRRVELSSLELYEGQAQSNSTAFSSLSAVTQPIVERQAFVFPSGVEAMRETLTEKGITSKHVLVALPSGGLLELPRFFLDPRRPTVSMSPDARDEGVIPYIPELPVHAEAIVNYNQTVLRVRGVYTAPSGLESTCLVLAYGLDLFYTRVTPSKNFDVLKDDFDHLLISAVLLSLMLASYITKRLAARKALKQAWK